MATWPCGGGLAPNPLVVADRAVFSVRIQVVLFGNALGSVRRVVDAAAAAAHHSLRHGAARAVELALGDSSSDPVLSDSDVEALKRRWTGGALAELSYQHFGDNLGSAGGSNRLAAEADVDVLLVLNPDVYLSPPSLTHLLGALADHSVAAADARQLPLEHPKAFDVRTGDTSWASGSCLIVRRSCFAEVGGFDAEHFFLYCDDVDLSWRMRLHGWRVVHIPNAAVFHDKRIARSGYPMPTPAEEGDGLIGRLMLAHRYDRPDIVVATEQFVERQGTPAQRAAMDEYRRRLAQGLLPEPLPGAERVAQFVDGEYAVHRF